MGHSPKVNDKHCIVTMIGRSYTVRSTFIHSTNTLYSKGPPNSKLESFHVRQWFLFVTWDPNSFVYNQLPDIKKSPLTISQYLALETIFNWPSIKHSFHIKKIFAYY